MKTQLFGTALALLPLSAFSSTTTSVSARVDCVHNFNLNKGAAQNCANISGLKISVSQQQTDKLKASISLDPFTRPAEYLDGRPNLTDRDLPTAIDSPIGIVDNYEVRLQFRPSLALSVVNFGGTTTIPSLSGTSMGSNFQESGWDQTAVLAHYHLAPLEGLDVLIAVGNGEGESGANLDPQQYGGLGLELNIIKGLMLKLGISFDGNAAGSSYYNWLYDNPAGTLPDSGYSTERMMAAVVMNGDWTVARGLQLVVGWQTNRQSDLNREVDAIPSGFYDSTTKRLDLADVFVEDPDHKLANTVERDVINVNMSYLILAKYRLGLDFESRTVKTRHVPFFQKCSQIVSSTCTAKGPTSARIAQTGITTGVAVNVAEGMTMSAEYRMMSYDDLYQRFYYQGEEGKGSKDAEIFNLRLAYNWE